MQETKDDVLAFMDFPKAHRTQLASTNPLERSRENGSRAILADIGIPRAVFRKLEIAYPSPFGRRCRVPIHRIET